MRGRWAARRATIVVAGFLALGAIPVGLLLTAPTARADTYVSGSISADTTGDLAGSPYVVVGDVTVALGATLTIDPGVTVRLDPTKSIVVQGALHAVGTAADPLLFTANSSAPPVSMWKSLYAPSGGRI